MKKLISIILLFLIPLVSAQTTIGQAKGFFGGFNLGGFNFGLIIVFFLFFIVIMIFVGVGTFLLIRFLKFKYTIEIWQDIEGHDDLEPAGKDKAMLVRAGKGGTELLYLKKRKVYRGSYGKRIGARRYFFVIGKDGYWHNSTLGSLEDGMSKIGIKPTNVNMRYQNEALMELIKQRYDKTSWWAQYGQILVNIVFFMIVALMFWLYFDAFKDSAGALTQAADSLKQAGDYFRQGVGGLDALRGSGGIQSG